MSNTKLIFLYLVVLLIVGCDKIQPVSSELSELEYFSNSEQVVLKSYPRVLYPGDNLKIKMPMPHPQKLAIVNPNGQWFYLQDEPNISPLIPYETFSKMSEFELDIANAKALIWNNGEKKKGLIFSKTGEYLIYLADNLETEPENTLHYVDRVFYHSKRE